TAALFDPWRARRAHDLRAGPLFVWPDHGSFIRFSPGRIATDGDVCPGGAPLLAVPAAGPELRLLLFARRSRKQPSVLDRLRALRHPAAVYPLLRPFRARGHRPFCAHAVETLSDFAGL